MRTMSHNESQKELKEVKSMLCIIDDQSCYFYTFSYCWFFCCLPYDYLYGD